jgi:large subunit ribosomal protein L14e
VVCVAVPFRKPGIGQIVQITKGREAGQYAIVIGYTGDRFVLLADGDKRKKDQPKKKNIIHVRPVDAIAPEVIDSIRETGRVSNAKLRFCIRRFLTQLAQVDDMTEKGE